MLKPETRIQYEMMDASSEYDVPYLSKFDKTGTPVVLYICLENCMFIKTKATVGYLRKD